MAPHPRPATQPMLAAGRPRGTRAARHPGRRFDRSPCAGFRLARPATSPPTWPACGLPGKAGRQQRSAGSCSSGTSLSEAGSGR